MYLGDIVRQLRMEYKLSVIELAKRVQVSEAYILNLENGKIPNPSFFKMVKIAQELDMDVFEMGDLYIDPEWIRLMDEARRLGLSREDVRNFLQHQHMTYGIK
ncbi:helix-turn-helix domain-containing protein [Pseudalkalibacillus decolorationis]|uniref:helix-turn-helix domain-containing protein n=1 Tax=Pseudalkalibacillus decolorationis TaxID=163879 RepID=UPI0021476F6B|nr:helix-turn-helix domain-containing protein [Pseudalkalibacillus decolorationis]